MRINSFADSGELEKAIATLSPEESHHLARVLRVEPGQELTLFDGRGTRAEAVVEAVNKKAVTARIVSRTAVPPPAVEITLIQALPKPDRFELVLQKATELGVRAIWPITSAHTVVPSGKLDKLFARGQSIIRNAAQQCGTAWLPELRPVEKMDTVLPELRGFDAVFIGSLYAGAKPFRELFQTVDKPSLRRVALLIGPEGDFSEAEAEAAVANGALPASFGSQILRTETAALFGLSVLAYELC